MYVQAAGAKIFLSLSWNGKIEFPRFCLFRPIDRLCSGFFASSSFSSSVFPPGRAACFFLCLQILEHHSAKMPLAPDVDLDTLACLTSGMTGADLANLLNFAAIRAATEGKDQARPLLLALCLLPSFSFPCPSLSLSSCFKRRAPLLGQAHVCGYSWGGYAWAHASPVVHIRVGNGGACTSARACPGPRVSLCVSSSFCPASDRMVRMGPLSSSAFQSRKKARQPGAERVLIREEPQHSALGDAKIDR